MFMVKKRPQLKWEELQQLKWALGSLLASISAWSVCHLGLDFRFSTTLVFIAAAAVLIWPSIPARIPLAVHRLAFLVVGLYLAFDLHMNRQPFPSLVRAELLLIVLRLIAYRRTREDLQLILLGLLLVVASGVYSASPLFVAQILAFAVCGLALLLLATISGGTEMGRGTGPDGSTPSTDAASQAVPSWAAKVRWRTLLQRICAVLDWRILLLGSLLFGGLLGSSGLLFFAIPRFEIGNDFLLDRLVSKTTMTGFSDTVSFGDVTDIQEDDGIAMTVDVSDPSLIPGTPYWRMVVLDEYSKDGFRMSAELSRYLSESTHELVQSVGGRQGSGPGDNGVWSIFLEPGVSRYLPLGGSFGRIDFSRPVSFSFNRALRLVALKAEPSELLGYQIHGHRMSAILPDPGFTARGSTGSHVPGFRGMRVNAGAESVLSGMVREFSGDVALGAEEFSRKACEWLWGRHAYSLQSTLPAGGDDPLVRWLQSGTPGHCEYFAGSFALLANAAGFPVRVVTGFKGGAWNTFSNSLIVRHTQAHAWCEIWNGRDAWIRVDPTPGTTAAVGEPAREIAAAEMRDRPVESGWGAKLDGLRVIWYRRVISFDGEAQGEMTYETLRGIDRMLTWMDKAARSGYAQARNWLLEPWSTRRLVIHSLLLFLAVTAFWLVSAARRSWAWRLLFVWHPRGDREPVRKEAARWLQRIRTQSVAFRSHPQMVRAREDLERLRFGPRSARVHAGTVFATARRAFAAARRSNRIETRNRN